MCILCDAFEKIVKLDQDIYILSRFIFLKYTIQNCFIHHLHVSPHSLVTNVFFFGNLNIFLKL
jgi:hypothetical protein